VRIGSSTRKSKWTDLFYRFRIIEFVLVFAYRALSIQV